MDSQILVFRVPLNQKVFQTLLSTFLRRKSKITNQGRSRTKDGVRSYRILKMVFCTNLYIFANVDLFAHRLMFFTRNATFCEKMLQKLKRWNYDASIVEGGNLMRVSYNSFSKKEEAIMALAEIRKDNKSAWLLTK